MDVDNDESRSRRRRKKTSRFEFDELDNIEQRLIQQAIRNSNVEINRNEIPIGQIKIVTA